MSSKLPRYQHNTSLEQENNLKYFTKLPLLEIYAHVLASKEHTFSPWGPFPIIASWLLINCHVLFQFIESKQMWWHHKTSLEQPKGSKHFSSLTLIKKNSLHINFLCFRRAYILTLWSICNGIELVVQQWVRDIFIYGFKTTLVAARHVNGATKTTKALFITSSIRKILSYM